MCSGSVALWSCRVAGETGGKAIGATESDDNARGDTSGEGRGSKSIVGRSGAPSGHTYVLAKAGMVSCGSVVGLFGRGICVRGRWYWSFLSSNDLSSDESVRTNLRAVLRT